MPQLKVFNPLGIDVTDEIELKNGRALPGGWSQYEVWHLDRRIGWIESGYPSDFARGYSAIEIPDSSSLEGQP